MNESGKEVDHWLVEKTSDALRDICYLVDWIRSQNIYIDEAEAEYAERHLAGAIDKLILILAEEAEPSDAFKHDWTSLMLEDGYERYVEFQEHLLRKVPDGTAPGLIPLRIRRDVEKEFEEPLASLDKAATILQQQREDESAVIESLHQLGTLLTGLRSAKAQENGARLLQIVGGKGEDQPDSWDTFLEQAEAVVQVARHDLMTEWEEMKKTVKKKPLFQTNPPV